MATNLAPGDKRLTTGDFDGRFSISTDGKLKFDNAIIETAVGLKRRDFILACVVAAVQLLNMCASWVNARKKPLAAPASLLSCPAPVINIPALTTIPARGPAKAAPPQRKY